MDPDRTHVGGVASSSGECTVIDESSIPTGNPEDFTMFCRYLVHFLDIPDFDWADSLLTFEGISNPSKNHCDFVITGGTNKLVGAKGDVSATVVKTSALTFTVNLQ